MHIAGELECTPRHAALGRAGDPAERLDSALADKFVRILRRREMLGHNNSHSGTRRSPSRLFDRLGHRRATGAVAIEAEGDLLETELREPLEQVRTRAGPTHRHNRFVTSGAQMMHIE